MKKKTCSVLLGIMLAATSLLSACGGATGSSATAATTSTSAASDAASSEGTAVEGTGIAAEDLKVGVIYVGDENEGYTESHMAGIDAMQAALGLTDDQVIEKTNIPEDETCYDAAVDLASQGCNAIFATSFGHEDYLLQAANEYPDIQFFHATGYQAASSGLSNFHNYFTKIYEARYVSGVVAGLKLNEMIESGKITEDKAKIGYVGAFPYAEVISGFTSFYLGAKSVCPSATMEVQYTNSWADMSAENEVATSLISNGAVLISQHADTTGAPSACEAAGVPCVGYNVDMTSVAPSVALTSAANNWGAYYTIAGQSLVDGTEIPVDYAEGYDKNCVNITPLNESVVAEGTVDKVAEVESALADGSLHVFDTTTFTIGGKTLEDLIAEGGDYAKYTAYVSDGYFHESEVGSAPAFDIIIDGVTAQAQ